MTKLSLYYDFQKWAIISLTSVAISLTVGLLLLSIQYAHGQEAFDPLSTKCVFFHSEQVVILSIGGLDDNLCNQQDGLNTLAYYAAQGYEIKAAFQNAQSLKNVIYLQKMP